MSGRQGFYSALQEPSSPDAGTATAAKSTPPGTDEPYDPFRARPGETMPFFRFYLPDGSSKMLRRVDLLEVECDGSGTFVILRFPSALVQIEGRALEPLAMMLQAGQVDTLRQHELTRYRNILPDVPVIERISFLQPSNG